jgi:hypothetical protein
VLHHRAAKNSEQAVLTRVCADEIFAFLVGLIHHYYEAWMARGIGTDRLELVVSTSRGRLRDLPTTCAVRAAGSKGNRGSSKAPVFASDGFRKNRKTAVHKQYPFVRCVRYEHRVFS